MCTQNTYVNMKKKVHGWPPSGGLSARTPWNLQVWRGTNVREGHLHDTFKFNL